MKTSHFYWHPIFKRIVDGEDWDGNICGYPPHGKHIFIGNKKEKVILFPPDHKLDKQSENDNEMSKSLFAGLKRINTITSNPDFGNCEKCKYYVDYFYADNQGYNVCGYPISQDS